MWDFSFMIPSALMLVTLLGFYFSRPRLPVRANRTFVVMLLAELLVMASDIVSTMIDENFTQYPVGVVYAANILYFVLYLTRIYWYYRFALQTVSAGVGSRVFAERILELPYVLIVALCISSPLTGAFFSVGPQGYVRGPFYEMLYVAAAFYIFVSLVFTIGYAKSLRRADITGLVGYNVVLIVGNVIRFAFPKVLVMDTFCTIAIMVIFLGFTNPELFLFEQGYAFNGHALRVLLGERIITEDYYVLGIALQNYNHERGLLGGANMDAAIFEINRWLMDAYPDCVTFYLGVGRFAVVGRQNINWQQVAEHLRDRFDHPWSVPSAEVVLHAGLVSASVDSGLKTADEIANMLIIALETAQQDAGLAAGMTTETLSLKEVDRQVGVLRALELAIEKREVEVFLQPVYQSSTHRMVAAEALARIRDEDGRIISPALFIPVAERTGYINQLGDQVLEKACEFYATHDAASLGLEWINVNISPIQCLRQDLTERMLGILGRYGIPVERIHLEVTEESIVDYALLQRQLMALRDAGFEFSLDDYGSGYSNLTRVREYPFANIKLDMSVVWDYFNERDNLLPAVVRGFRDTGYTITAEGIENEEMAQALVEIGSDYLQGYYFSKPLDLDAFMREYGAAA